MAQPEASDLVSGESNAAETAWWVYLLACKDGRTYAGIARDVEARFAAHLSGKAAKFTRANPPLRILGAQAFPTRSEALRAEYALKQMTPAAKREWARLMSIGVCTATLERRRTSNARNRQRKRRT